MNTQDLIELLSIFLWMFERGRRESEKERDRLNKFKKL